MKSITQILGILAGMGGALLGIIVTSSAAFAYEVPARGGATSPAIASGGMAGWQITLIAFGAALCASVLAVLADRALAARRQHPATSA